MCVCVWFQGSNHSSHSMANYVRLSLLFHVESCSSKLFVLLVLNMNLVDLPGCAYQEPIGGWDSGCREADGKKMPYAMHWWKKSGTISDDATPHQRCKIEVWRSGHFQDASPCICGHVQIRTPCCSRHWCMCKVDPQSALIERRLQTLWIVLVWRVFVWLELWLHLLVCLCLHSLVCLCLCFLSAGMALVVAPILAGEGILGGLRGECRRVEDKFVSMGMELKSVQITFDLAQQHGNRTECCTMLFNIHFACKNMFSDHSSWQDTGCKALGSGRYPTPYRLGWWSSKGRLDPNKALFGKPHGTRRKIPRTPTASPATTFGSLSLARPRFHFQSVTRFH